MLPILAQFPAEGTETGRIADAAVATWLGVAAALSPIIGERGFAAMYKRCLHLMRVDYPWLTAVHEAAPAAYDFTALQTALALQTDSTAAAANGALLRCFYDLLITLIGESLTQRLLDPVLVDPSSGDAAQESAP
jgi:hypothetical protein